MKDKIKLWSVVSVVAFCGIGANLMMDTSDSDHSEKSGWRTSPEPDTSLTDKRSTGNTVEDDARAVSKAKEVPAQNKHANKPEPAQQDRGLPPVEDQLPVDVADSEPVELWNNEKMQASGDEYLVNIPRESIQSLQVGQSLKMDIPQLNGSVVTRLTDTRNQYGDNHVFSGPIEGRSEMENVTIVRGKQVTYMTIATMDGTFGAEIDNNTGNTRIWDEAIASDMKNEPVFIQPAPEELQPPEGF